MSGMTAAGHGLAPVIPLRPAYGRSAAGRRMASYAGMSPAHPAVRGKLRRAAADADQARSSRVARIARPNPNAPTPIRADRRVRSHGGNADGLRLDGGHSHAVGGQAGLRLTRRGRIVLVIALMIIAAALGSASARAFAAVGEPRQEVRSVVVASGESLWSIATRYAPDRDPHDTIEAIRRENRLTGTTLYVGQSLDLPPGPAG